MPKDFIIVQQARIRKTVIKFYEPIGLMDLIIHYNVPRTEKRFLNLSLAKNVIVWLNI